MEIDNKKVYFITRGGIDCCTYIRSYMPQLLNDWDGDNTGASTTRPLNEAKELFLNSDVVVFQRQSGDDVLEMIKDLHKLGKKVVWDVDDTYMCSGLVDRCLGNDWAKKEEIRARQVGSVVDMITCSTQALVDEWKEKLPFQKVELLENCVYEEWFPIEIKKNNTDKLRFCITGSCLAKTEWKIIKPLIEKITNDGNTLVVFGVSDDAKVLSETIDTLQNRNNVELIPSCDVQDYYYELNDLRIDCCLIPREEKYFNVCKSNLKFLECSMLKIPCIVSSFKENNSPYDSLPNNVCFKCKTEEDWLYAYEKIKDKEIRNTISLNAYKYVKDNYNIEKRYKDWRIAYNKLFEDNEK